MKRLASGASWLCIIVPFCQCLVDYQLSAAVNPGTFATPTANVRPRFRYWLPDASVDVDTVVADIAASGSLGAGGIELLPFFEYGGQIGSQPAGADWSTYNFGTVPYRNLFAAALSAHEKHGLVMDFALGPNQGQGVPANQNNTGLQWDLVPFTAEVPDNGSFVGLIPGWGTGELVSFATARVTSNKTITFEATGLLGIENVTYDQYVLSSGSLLDQTAQVSANGTVQISLQGKEDGQHYRIFSFYQKLSGNKNLQFNNTSNGSIFDEGSYVVDHFDAKGADTIIQFWEEHILVDGIREQLQNSGHYAWEDSLEILSNVSWSRSLPSRFQELFGYDIKPFLPLLAFRDNNIGLQPTEPGSFECILDTDDQGVGYINDFRATLAAGYQEYISTLTDWTHRLGVSLSLQPAYGLPMDMQTVIPDVDAPECESLSFLDSIDLYRKFAGPANLAGRQVISNELGAVKSSAFRYHLPELLFSANRGFAAGVNQYVIHGQAFSGNYYQTTWPGHVAFDYHFSEPWSPREPVWEHGFEETLNYMARVQHVQQSGVPKIDVAIYNKESATSLQTVYELPELIERGWNYNYLSPENLELPQAVVENGVLAPEGPAWKALVVQSGSNLTLSAIATLQSFAESGLPILFVGAPPKLYPTASKASNVTVFEEHLAVLEATEGVYTINEDQLADQLSTLGLCPKVSTNTNGTWYTTWRETTEGGYALIYADLIASSGNVTVADTRTPYYLNPWTGTQSPVLVYEQDLTSTTIPLELAGNQTAIILFTDSNNTCSVPAYHVTSAPAGVIGADFTLSGGLGVHVTTTVNDGEAVLSNNAVCSIDGSGVPAAFELTEWELIAEHWEAPSNISNVEQPMTKFNTTHSLSVLTSWLDIPALVNTSGIGYYTSTFMWPTDTTNTTASTLGAYISFDNVLHSLRVQVNGNQIPPLDITHARADISAYLQPGNNTVTAVVPTTWWNYLKTILDTLESSGLLPLPLVLEAVAGQPLPGASDEGLMPGVHITPFKRVVC
ncbi:hypothetical protein PFICI_14782 [Pestalotiopsis fici W106-1]|uniref:Secreted protein n=1 Tax=Pestalotiopsis fici (strain W106-1 / CGMCC3.15140) TaxID=1229662 RepID=W3WM11_PESFW|nr:uncharacterized protein PFICI_14782 [Pestalotiopsis fici W106-1]ETS73836.1 hypothetical protein PFICI_14782 [Pestalotiopsis fici W106-1]